VPSNGNGNGRGGTLAVVEGVALPAVVEPTFKPRHIDWLYLEAVEDITATDGRLTFAAISKRLPGKPDPETGEARPMTKEGARLIYKRPGFQGWLKAQQSALSDTEWPSIVRRAIALALRGSIDHMNFIAKLRGEFKDERPAGGGASNVINGNAIIVHVHE
jgi:hypothetical protein